MIITITIMLTISMSKLVGNLSEVSNVSMSTVSFHNFKSQKLKLSVSNPKSKYVAYLSVLSQIYNCQSLGRKNKLEILKTDRNATRKSVGSFQCQYVSLSLSYVSGLSVCQFEFVGSFQCELYMRNLLGWLRLGWLEIT